MSDSRKLIVLSGVASGHSGSARLIMQWQEHVRAKSYGREEKVYFVFGKEGTGNPLRWIRYGRFKKAFLSPLRRIAGDLRMRHALRSEEVLSPKNAVLLCHPQGIGYRNTIEFLHRRKAPVWIYLLDNSYFCLKSYNHINEEFCACLRCLATGPEAASELGCRPYAATYKLYQWYSAQLSNFVKTGRVRFIAQCKSQEDLIRRHFGSKAHVVIAGIWGDWDVEVSQDIPDCIYDIVFHGACRHAKGYLWAIEVARACPGKKFLFPFHVAETNLGGDKLPTNCYFIPMSWERGLRASMAASRLVLVPSLWSAPVEGSLIKSLALGCAVTVVDQETGVASELPDDCVVRLSQSPEMAAERLMSLTDDDIEGFRVKGREWAEKFRQTNVNAFDRVVDICRDKAVS